jgi:hypothetical protein
MPPSSAIIAYARGDMRAMSHLGVVEALSSSSSAASHSDIGGSALADVRSWMETDGAAQRRGSDEELLFVLMLVLLNGSAAGADEGRQTCIYKVTTV